MSAKKAAFAAVILLSLANDALATYKPPSCGVSSVISTLRYFEMDTSIEEVESYLLSTYPDIEMEAISIAQLVDALKQFGVIARAYQSTSKAIQDLESPAIMHVASDWSKTASAEDFDHYVFLASKDRDFVNLLDLTISPRCQQVGNSDLVEAWSGVYLSLRKTGTPTVESQRSTASWVSAFSITALAGFLFVNAVGMRSAVWFGFVLAVVCLPSIGCTANDTNDVTVVAEPNFIDLGVIDSHGKVRSEFTISSSEPVKVSNVSPSCVCIQVPSDTFGAEGVRGTRTRIPFFVDADGEVGSKSHTLIAQFDDHHDPIPVRVSYYVVQKIPTVASGTPLVARIQQNESANVALEYRRIRRETDPLMQALSLIHI